MRAGKGIVGMALVVLALSACSGPKDPILMHASAAVKTPDEFAILPTKPLEMPKDTANLPVPTPGGTNRTDPTPSADAIAALGGKAAVLGRSTTAADGALLADANRYGTAPDIRATLAAEDLTFRRKNNGKLLERVFALNIYYRAYSKMALDQYAELARWRKVGVATPSAPPKPKGK